MSQTAVQTRDIPVQEATEDAVAPFGALISSKGGAATRPSAFYEGSVSLFPAAPFESDDDTSLTLASMKRRALTVRWMERHYKHTQVFLPLGGKPYVVVVAPPNDQDVPDVAQARAFKFDGSVGFVMKKGTWHEFPFAIEDGTDVLVILRHETTRSLEPNAVIDGEARGPDIDKKDITRRLGIELHVTGV